SLILVRPGDRLEFRVVRERGKGAMPREGYRVSETIVREVISRGQPRIVSDIAHDADLSAVKSVVSLQLGSAAAMPLWRFALVESGRRARSTDEVFGVLYLDSQVRRDAFSRFDIGMLENLARDASSAIENARLLRNAEEKRRMEREIRTARAVQTALMPKNYWTEPHFEVSGSWVPCLDLGGDYLDQYRLSDGRAGFVVADVCGKGLPAALLAATLQGALAAEMANGHPLATVVERVNWVISRLAPLGDFISMLCCVLAPDGRLTHVNAGHCPLLTVFGNEVQSLVTEGSALGVHEAARYEPQTVQLRPGETAVLYTDGVLEARNATGELFGEDRLEATLDNAGDRSAAQTVEEILAAVHSFRGEQPVADDITLMAIRYLGGG
ncbi:MAG: PP2C family protein-serine/threonine phosphatase, partial [Planctomycetota bacterium]